MQKLGTCKWLALAVAVLLCACTHAPTGPGASSNTPLTTEALANAPAYKAASWSQLPGWPGDGLLSSWQAFRASCGKVATRPDFAGACKAAAALTPIDLPSVRSFFEANFDVWQLQTPTGAQSGLITGYYEAFLSGGRTYKPGRVPILGVPDDLLTIELGDEFPQLAGQRVRGRIEGQKVVPYWNRHDIDAGRAGANAKVLAWVDNPLDAFFLQVQGSGRIHFEDGSVLRVGYADQNGQPYRAIGKWLVDQGQLTLADVTMQSIRAWARAHPERLRELLEANPSYVFFKVLPETGTGVVGALNVPLTAEASIAVDTSVIPLGSPVYLATTRPDNQAPLQGLVQAQDTGGAIRGPVRADYFWGASAAATDLAGLMKQQGQLWLLWPKGRALPAH